MNEKIELQRAILQLEALIADKVSAENEYQEFFENNPIVFDVLGYTRWWAFTKTSGRSLPIDPYTGLKPEPDFIAETQSGLFEILELKTPTSKNLLVESNQYRERFTAEIASYVSQTTTYEKYFTRNPHNREAVKQLYGIDIQEDLDIKIVIGLNANLDKAKVHQKARELNRKIDIITYDDVLGILENRYQQTYGFYEGLKGLSSHSIVRFRRIQTPSRKYFFDSGADPVKNRASLFLDENSELHFQVVDSASNTHEVNISHSHPDVLDRWIYLACEIGETSDGFLMTISFNGEALDQRERRVTAALTSDVNSSFFLGCDITHQHCGYFDLAEHVVIDHTLPFREQLGLLQYFWNKYANLMSVKEWHEFNGRAWMTRGPDGHLRQDDPSARPIHRKEAAL